MDTSSIPSHWLIASNSFLEESASDERSRQGNASFSRVIEPGEVFCPDEVDGGAAVVEEEAAEEHQRNEKRRSKSQGHVDRIGDAGNKVA